MRPLFTSHCLAAAWAVLAAVAAGTPNSGFPLEPMVPEITPKPADWKTPEVVTPANPAPDLGTLVSAADRKRRAEEFLQKARIDLAKPDGLRAGLFDLTRAIEEDPATFSPTMIHAWIERANLRMKLNDYKHALADFDLLFPHDPTNWLIANDRGFAKMNLEDYAGALDDLNLAIACDPDQALPYINIGALKTRQKDYAAAHAWYDQAKAHNPSDPILYLSRAILWRREGQPTNQRADLEKALAINPRLPTAYRDLGYLALLDGDYPGAISYLNRSLALNPNDSSAYINRATAFMGSGQFEEAQADYISTINHSPKTDDYQRIFLWIARSKHGNQAGALTMVLTSKNDWTRAVAQLLQGTMSEADFRQAAKTIPVADATERECEAEYYLGIFNLVHDDPLGAKEHFRNCIVTGHPNFYEHMLASGELARMR